MKETLDKRQRAAFGAIIQWVQSHGRTPSVRQLASELGYRSPRSASVLIDQLIELGLLKRRQDRTLKVLAGWGTAGLGVRTVRVPLVGTASCGVPLLADENTEGFLTVSADLVRGSSRYFLLRASGDSMDRAGIRDGDLVLVRQQETAAEGDSVVALIDDEAVIKIFRRGAGGVVLQPMSSNPIHVPILVAKDFRIQGVVVSTIPREDLDLLEL